MARAREAKKWHKAELVERVATKADIPKDDAARVIDTMLAETQGLLGRGDTVVLTGFGTFEVRRRQARAGMNPATKQRIEIPERLAVGFRPGKELKDAVAT